MLNALIFIPLGVAVALIGRRPLWRAAIIAALLPPWVVEGVQLLLGPLTRDAQWQDVIDNSLGVVIGLALGYALRRRVLRQAAVAPAANLCIMNSYSPNDVAVLLGVSRRRVTSAADRGGIGTSAGRRRVFTDEDVTLMREHLGTTPVVESLSRSEVAVLAELSRRPCGLVSARAVARACGLSPATAAKAVHSLVEARLVVEHEHVVALGRARRVRSLHANVRHPRWGALLPVLRQAIPPVRSGPSPSERVPAHVRHAFWNVDDDALSRVTPDTDGPFIATRALTTGDLDLLAYAAATVAPSSWRQAGRARGLTGEQRALAASLAGARA